MNNPLVSIIIPTYNRAHLIGETLDSIVAQTYTNWECIIVDDGSTDNTVAVINKYIEKDARFQYHTRPSDRPKGGNAARNYGMKLSQGSFLIFFDSDDIMVTRCLERRIETILKLDLDMVIFSMGTFYDINNLEAPAENSVYNDTLDNTLKDFLLSPRLPWNVCKPIFKASLIKNKISFNEELGRFQDVEFNIKLLKQCKPSYKSVSIVDSYYRMEDKYYTEHFIMIIFPNLLLFYKSIFNLLDLNEISRFRNGLYKVLFDFIKAYVRHFVTFSQVSALIKLFTKELSLNRKEQAILYSILILNKYYYEKKGYHSCRQFLKRQIESYTRT